MANAATFNTFALIYSQERDIEQAMKYINKALDLSPRDPQLEKNKQLILENKNDPSTTGISNTDDIEIYEGFVTKDEIEPSLCFENQQPHVLTAAEVLVNAGNYYAAQKKFQIIVDCLPENISARIGLADALTELEKYDEAEPHYIAVLEIEPNNLRGKTGLGHLHAKSGSFEDAQTICSEVIDIDPSYYQAFTCLGELHKNAGNFEKGIEFFKKSVNIESVNNVAYNGLGFSYFVIGDFESSVENYAKRLEGDGENKDALFGLMINAKIQGDDKTADDFHSQISAVTLQKYLKMIDRADNYVVLQEWDAALSLYSASKYFSNDLAYDNRISTGMGNVYKGMDEFEIAKKYYLETLARSDNDFNALKGMCALHLSHDKTTEQAQKYYDRARDAPNSSSSLDLECPITEIVS
jgi:tetratricopeptide (TPR) repeat protein